MNRSSQNIRYLTVENVMRIHQNTIGHEGGHNGLRDAGLLDAAVAMPRQVFGGQLLHEDIASAAAAYLYHIACNHPFIDGNKRVAAATMLMFLRVNGITTLPAPKDLERYTLSVAAGTMSKTELTDWLRKVIHE